MNDFKVGDEVWFYFTETGRYVLEGHGTGVFPEDLIIYNGSIVGIDETDEVYHVYIKGYSYIYAFIIYHTSGCIFKSKNEAINAMIKRLEEMRDE